MVMQVPRCCSAVFASQRPKGCGLPSRVARVMTSTGKQRPGSDCFCGSGTRGPSSPGTCISSSCCCWRERSCSCRRSYMRCCAVGAASTVLTRMQAANMAPRKSDFSPSMAFLALNQHNMLSNEFRFPSWRPIDPGRAPELEFYPLIRSSVKGNVRGMNQITLTLTLLFFLAMLSSQASTTPLHQTVPVLSGTNNQEEQLQRAIRDASQLSRTEQHVIINLLRLRLAAVQMQRDDFELGRDTLRQIDTDSPAALQASLLMAESYRLTGQAQEARSWFLRTAHHYPYRTATLDGLISAARDEQQHNPGLSAALYSEISRQSQYALDQLNQLHRGGNVDPMTIILPSPLDDEIRQALLRRCLQHPE